MNGVQYQRAIRETGLAIYPGTGSIEGLPYTALGINDELAELVLAMDRWASARTSEDARIACNDVKAELGDVAWYIAECASCADIDLETDETMHRDMSMMLASMAARDLGRPIGSSVATQHLMRAFQARCGGVAGTVKKLLRDGGGLLTPDRRLRLTAMLNQAWTVAEVVARQCGLDFNEVLAANIDKLLSRKARGVLKGDGDHR